jgi:glutathione S-transferase
VPFLKLSCGTVVAETISICKLIEDAAIGKAKLFGDTTIEQGVVSMWQRRIDGHIVIPAMDHFRWGPARDMFKERGMHAAGQPDAAEGRKQHVMKQLKWLEDLADKSSDFICCNKITIVDVQLFCIMNFFMTFDAVGPPCFAGCFDELPWLKAWHSRMSARPAAAASTPSA